MTANVPEPPSTPPQETKSSKKFRVWVGMIVGAIVLLGGGFSYAQYYIYRQLSPRVEQQLGKILNRPLNLGAVQGFSLSGIRLGYSELPKTEQHNDQVLLESVVVNYSLWRFITKRELNLDLTLINPQVYIEQDGDRQWVALDLKLPEPKPDQIKVNLGNIQVRRGNVTLVARQPSGTLQRPIDLAVTYGTGKFSDKNRAFDFDAKGDLLQGGKLEFSGNTHFIKRTIELNLRAKKSPISVVTDFLSLPLTLNEGLVDGSIAMYFDHGQLLSWQGGVVAEDVTVSLPQLVKPIRGVDSKIAFQQKQLQFNDLTGTLGDIALGGELIVDLQQGLEGKLVTAPVEIAKLLNTFQLKPPNFALTGQLKGLVTLTGKLEQPRLLINAVNHKPLKVDRLSIEQFQGTLAVVGNRFVLDQFVAMPTLGGELTGKGIIQLPNEQIPTGAIAVKVQGTQLPSNALAQLYEVSVPVQLGLGKTDLIFEAPLNKPDNFLVSGTAVVPVAGGVVTATNLKVSKDFWQTPAKAEGLRLAQLTNQTLPPFLQRSLVNGEFAAAGALNQDKQKNKRQKAPALEVTGQARTTVAGGQAIARNLKVKDGQWFADLDLTGLDVRQLAPQFPRTVAARYSGKFKAAGSLENTTTETVEVLGSGRLTVGQGSIRTENVAVARGAWYTRAVLDNVNLVSFAPQLGQVDQTVASDGVFEVKGTVNNPQLENILAQGSVEADLAGGRIKAGLLTLQQGKLRTDLTANNINLKAIAATMQGVGNGKAQVVADLTQPNFNLKQVQAQGELTLSRGLSIIDQPLQSRWAWNGKQLQIQEAIAQGFRADGVLDINSDRLGKNPMQAITKVALNVNAQNLDLADLTLPPAAAALNIAGQGDFRGTVQGSLQQPTINGDISLSNGKIGELTLEPTVTGTIQTRGDRRTIVSLTGDNDKIQARLNSHLRPEQIALTVGTTRLNANLNYNASGVTPLTLQLTSENFPVAIAHRFAQAQPALQNIDFPIESMQLGGTLASELNANLQAKSAAGRITIDQPLVGYLQGDRLRGDFYYGNQTLMLRDLAWQQRGGTYSVDSTITFPDQGKPTIQTTGTIEQGRIEDVLVALQLFDYQDLQNLGRLSLPDYVGRSSKFNNSLDLYNLPTLASLSQLAQATSITSRQVPDQPTVTDPPDNREKYRCDRLLAADQPQGNQLFVRGTASQTFFEKLALLSCVKAQLNDPNTQVKPLLPAELADLTGEINGTLNFTYDDTDGLQADFDLNGGYREIEVAGAPKIVGTPWQWGEIEMPQIIAKGVLRNNVLTLRPIGIRLADQDGGGRISFIGSFGGQTQTGQLRLTQVPTAFLQKFVELPDTVGVEGLINVNAALSGTADDPSARGDMTMEKVTINDTPIDAVTGNFTYEDARLDFIVDSKLVADAEPLKVTGSIPYQLPNATIAPASNALKLTFNLQDEGFILLNILSQGQLAWLNGEGNVDLTIDGSINPNTGRPVDLVARGQAAIAKAEIKAQALPDAPLTNVHGTIDFNFNRLTVNELTGDFSGGRFDIKGQLPIAKLTTEPQTLNVALENLNFELPKLYRGGVNGNLIIAGTSLEPVIGGNLELTEGRVFLSGDQAATETTATTATETPAPDTQDLNKQQSKQTAIASSRKPTRGIDLRSITQFQDLKITLGNNIQITRQPILNFLATGDLTLNGTLETPRPNGVIRLRRGQVNLFATQLSLDNGHRNTATFIPTFGLDPELDVVLRTSIVENPRTLQQTTDPLSAEISDLTVFNAGRLGSIETIRVQARVKGKASDLDNSLVLSSSPPRNETEIIALLGGSLLENFATDNGTETLALANLAGSALLNTIQDAIGTALGLSELRLFPTVITDEEKRESTLGLGAEVSMDLSPSFSLSLLQILNSREATQFGLRYRLNDQIFMRGSTDLNDDNRFTVEYDLRF